jgi:hypothetical protein
MRPGRPVLRGAAQGALRGGARQVAMISANPN